MSKTETKKSLTSEEEIKTTKRFVLEGVEKLSVEKVTTTYEIVTKLENSNNRRQVTNLCRLKLDEKVEKLKTFHLTEISVTTLNKYRKKGIPSFLLKIDGKLYHTEIPETLSFENAKLLGAHRCALVWHECQRLLATSDENGGCKKVRDRVKRIERYPWITVGYETFNTKHDCFIVIECSHYEHR